MLKLVQLLGLEFGFSVGFFNLLPNYFHDGRYTLLGLGCFRTSRNFFDYRALNTLTSFLSSQKMKTSYWRKYNSLARLLDSARNSFLTFVELLACNEIYQHDSQGMRSCLFGGYSFSWWSGWGCFGLCCLNFLWICTVFYSFALVERPSLRIIWRSA